MYLNKYQKNKNDTINNNDDNNMNNNKNNSNSNNNKQPISTSGFPLNPQLHIYPLEIELKKENISPSVASFLRSGNRNFKSPYDKRSSFPFFIVPVSQSAK